jgi:outer membrane biosynthesis protein TonB
MTNWVDQPHTVLARQKVTDSTFWTLALLGSLSIHGGLLGAGWWLWQHNVPVKPDPAPIEFDLIEANSTTVSERQGASAPASQGKASSAQPLAPVSPSIPAPERSSPSPQPPSPQPPSPQPPSPQPPSPQPPSPQPPSPQPPSPPPSSQPPSPQPPSPQPPSPQPPSPPNNPALPVPKNEAPATSGTTLPAPGPLPMTPNAEPGTSGAETLPGVDPRNVDDGGQSQIQAVVLDVRPSGGPPGTANSDVPDTPAQPRERIRSLPNYPPGIEAGFGQPVVLLLEVGENGKPGTEHRNADGTLSPFISIQQSSGSSIYDNFVMNMVSEWEFTPAIQAGSPVRSQIQITVKIDRR